jgi:hypothetical protein
VDRKHLREDCRNLSVTTRPDPPELAINIIPANITTPTAITADHGVNSEEDATSVANRTIKNGTVSTKNRCNVFIVDNLVINKLHVITIRKKARKMVPHLVRPKLITTQNAAMWTIDY